MIYRRSLFVFRRDLRFIDNTALEAALKQSQEVVIIFIADPRQYQDHPYKSVFGLNFLIDSLMDLQLQANAHGAKLCFCEGKAENVIEDLIEELSIQAVFINEDYTPFSIKRDLAIETICQKNKIAFHAFADALLHEPRAIGKPDGKGPYVIFTPFYKRCQQFPVRKSSSLVHNNFFQGKVSIARDDIIKMMSQSLTNCHPECSEGSIFVGGRKAGLVILKKMGEFKNYDERRNFPIADATTHLSAHHKFGTVSIRETYATIVRLFGNDHALIRELYWRDFFTHIAYHYPQVFGHAFYEEYDRIKWYTNKEDFQRWCEGKTGFPIVDAGMRQLNQTGFMHNRVRMIVASFLVKDMHMDWRLGERYFATKLIDYDPCVNNGNWQWVASTGCDHQPYYRIFNPWLQQQRFDPQCQYIKKWIPELRDVSVKDIHSWYEDSLYRNQYPAPMLDHKVESSIAKEMFKNVKR